MVQVETNSHNNSSMLLYSSNLKTDDRNATKRKRTRIMMVGPIHSGKSSLAMEFAYSKACSVIPCLCVDIQMCCCVAVTMFRANPNIASLDGRGKEDVLETDDFPFYCRPVEGIIRSSQPGNDWDPQVLQRIRVHRLTTVRELLHELLSLLGKPLQEQPRAGGAIIIEDIDKIVAQDPSLATRSYRNCKIAAIQQIGRLTLRPGLQILSKSISTMSILLTWCPFNFASRFATVAVATSTAIDLEEGFRNTTSCPISILITATDVRTTLSPCIDTIVALHPQQHWDKQRWKICHSSQQNRESVRVDDDNTNLIVQCVWSAKLLSTLYASPEAAETSPMVMEYALIENTVDGDKEIRWRPV